VRATERLRPLHRRYASDISTPAMAVSLETAALIWVCCDKTQPRRVLELGSGFSTYVLAQYAQTRASGTSVVSLDDDRYWVQRTREFLEEQGALSPALQLVQAVPWGPDCIPRFRQDGEWDLIFHDAGTSEISRGSWLPALYDALNPGGWLIVDDMHKPKNWNAARDFARGNPSRLYSLRSLTRDSFGRFAALIVKP
jgi:predicted O-methyltransferase YrrM